MAELKKVIIWKDGTEEHFDNESEFLYRVTTLQDQGYVKDKEGFKNEDFYVTTTTW